MWRSVYPTSVPLLLSTWMSSPVIYYNTFTIFLYPAARIHDKYSEEGTFHGIVERIYIGLVIVKLVSLLL